MLGNLPRDQLLVNNENKHLKHNFKSMLSSSFSPAKGCIYKIICIWNKNISVEKHILNKHTCMQIVKCSGQNS